MSWTVLGHIYNSPSGLSDYQETKGTCRGSSHLSTQPLFPKPCISSTCKRLSEEQKIMEGENYKRHLLNSFYVVFQTLESLKSYRSFDLSGVPLSALDCTVLAVILESCTNVEKLNLCGCSLDTEGIERLAPRLHNLQNLRLDTNDPPDTSCIQLASIIRNNRSLKKLDLSNNRLSGPHFSDLMEAMSSPGCGIRELRLAANGLSDKSCPQLASGIRNNRSLKKLGLSGNRLYGPHFRDLMEALSDPTCRIKELYLDGDKFSEEEERKITALRAEKRMKIYWSTNK